LKIFFISKLVFLLRKKIRNSSKGLFDYIYFALRVFLAKPLGLYPFPIRNEVGSLTSILISGKWNASYSLTNKITETEEKFCEFLNSRNCILVSSGGVGIEIVMRLLKSNNTNVTCNHLRHICPATPLSILRSGVAPLPTNPFKDEFSLPKEVYEKASKENLVLATHMWGYPEEIRNYSPENIVEDCCLSFDSYFPDGRHVGTIGKAGIFSFGCLKPLQAGEGGLICTDDDELAKEIRIMQNYANQEQITGSKDILGFGLNGRMSCLTAGVIYEQLKNYRKYINNVRRGVLSLKKEIKKRDLPVSIFLPNNQKIENIGFTSILLEVNPSIYSKLILELRKNGIETIPTFFNDIFSLSYFQKGIKNQLSQNQLEIYLENFEKSSNYQYPNRLINISRRWVTSYFMRSIFIQSLSKSLSNF